MNGQRHRTQGPYDNRRYFKRALLWVLIYVALTELVGRPFGPTTLSVVLAVVIVWALAT